MRPGRIIMTNDWRSIFTDPGPCTAAICVAATMLLAATTSHCAVAADVRIGEVIVRLPPPDRYCELDPVVGSDGVRLGSVHATLKKAGMRLLAMSAVCTDLEAWRLDQTRELDHWAEYQTSVRLDVASLPHPP